MALGNIDWTLCINIWMPRRRSQLIQLKIFGSIIHNILDNIKEMSSFVCSQQPNIWFLLKMEIHREILNTKPFLCNFWGVKYLQNKMGFLIRWFWSKLKLFNLYLPHVMKMIKIKTVITSIQSVCGVSGLIVNFSKFFCISILRPPLFTSTIGLTRGYQLIT